MVPFCSLAQKDPLDKYVEEGIENNLVIQQKSISLEKALLGLNTARSMFLPSVAFQFNYQSGDGGRTIPLPVGDLLNGVYATLNQLTGGQNFPQLENQNISFFPKNFYDTKFRTTVPILNTDLIYNKKINEQQVTLKEYEVDTYKRELVKNIKTAYFNYLIALNGIGIYESSLNIAKEGKRVNQKLVESGKGLPAYVLRSESEVAAANAKLIQTKQQADNARMYFNSLLNKPADAPVDTAYDADDGLGKASALMLSPAVPIENREELKSLKQVVELNKTIARMNKSFTIPKLGGFIDIGSQAEGWSFDKRSRYYLAGIQLDIPVFEGNRNRNKISQAWLDIKQAQLNVADVSRQLNVSANVAKNNLRSALETYQSSVTQLNAAASYQRLIEKGYKAGTNSYIETIDARNQLTSARLAVSIDKYNVLIAAAGVEREVANYQIKK